MLSLCALAICAPLCAHDTSLTRASDSGNRREAIHQHHHHASPEANSSAATLVASPRRCCEDCEGATLSSLPPTKKFAGAPPFASVARALAAHHAGGTLAELLTAFVPHV